MLVVHIHALWHTCTWNKNKILRQYLKAVLQRSFFSSQLFCHKLSFPLCRWRNWGSEEWNDCLAGSWESRDLWSWGLGLWEKTQLPGWLVRCRSLEDVRRWWRAGMSVSSESEVLFRAREVSGEPWMGREKGEDIGLSDHHTREVAVGNVVGRVEWQRWALLWVGSCQRWLFFLC